MHSRTMSDDHQAGRVDYVFTAFRCAFSGMACLVRTQRHAKFDLAATIVVFAGAAIVRVSSLEWCALVLAIGMVWTAEALNTALEFLADAVCPDHNLNVGRSKDIAAGGVLIAAFAAAAVGMLIIVPKLFLSLAPNP